jgi:hypothetical protein
MLVISIAEPGLSLCQVFHGIAWCEVWSVVVIGKAGEQWRVIRFRTSLFITQIIIRWVLWRLLGLYETHSEPMVMPLGERWVESEVEHMTRCHW